MNQNLTEIAFILDRSGSMAALADEAIGAFNSFLNDQRKRPGERRLTLAIFDHEYGLEHDRKNVEEVPELKPEHLYPPVEQRPSWTRLEGRLIISVKN